MDLLHRRCDHERRRLHSVPAEGRLDLIIIFIPTLGPPGTESINDQAAPSPQDSVADEAFLQQCRERAEEQCRIGKQQRAERGESDQA